MKNFIKKIRPGTVLAIVMLALIIPNTAFAISADMNDALLKMQEVINVGFGLVHAAFWPVLLMIGSLMDNDLIFGPEIGERLREIWVIMRNIVNIVFVFVLLVIAFYNVTGFGGEGNFALKSALPKFVMALVAVNFSFLACKVILDAANVVTVAVYDIAGTIEEYDANEIRSDMERSICTDPAYVVCVDTDGAEAYNPSTSATEGADAAASTEGAEVASGGTTSAADCGDAQPWAYSSAGPLAKAFCCTSNTSDDTTCVNVAGENVTAYKAANDEAKKVYPALNDVGKSFFRQLDQNNIGVVMAINLGSLNTLTQTAPGQTHIGIKEISINTLFSTLMYIVFGFAYVALFIVLLARLVVLWLVIALSPMIALSIVVPQVNQYASELNLGEKFLQHLMAPIIIGLAMSVGYLMAMQVKNSGAGGLELQGVGSLNAEQVLDGGVTGTFLSPNVSDLQQLMIACIAVAIVWLGVFGAADKTIASSITSPIKEFGTNAAKFIGKLPTYLPMVPIMTRDSDAAQNFSFQDITGTLKNFTKMPDKLAQTRTRSLTEKFMPGFYTQAAKDYEDLMTKLDDKTDVAGTIKGLIKPGMITTSAQYARFRDKLKEHQVQGIEDVKMSEFNTWFNSGGKEKISSAYGGIDLGNVTASVGSATPPATAPTTTGTGPTEINQRITQLNNVKNGADPSTLGYDVYASDGTTKLDPNQVRALANGLTSENQSSAIDQTVTNIGGRPAIQITQSGDGLAGVTPQQPTT